MHLLCFNPLNSRELCIKRTYCSGHIQEVCIRSSRLFGTNWAHEDPRVDPSHIPPPTSPFVSSPLSGVQENGGEGEEPLPAISCLLGSMANGTFKMKMDIDRHGPRPMPNSCKNLNPPNFSLPSIFKGCSGT